MNTEALPENIMEVSFKDLKNCKIKPQGFSKAYKHPKIKKKLILVDYDCNRYCHCGGSISEKATLSYGSSTWEYVYSCNICGCLYDGIYRKDGYIEGTCWLCRAKLFHPHGLDNFAVCVQCEAIHVRGYYNEEWTSWNDTWNCRETETVPRYYFYPVEELNSLQPKVKRPKSKK